MLVLLPPSESKAAGRRGAAVRVEDLSFPELTEARLEVLTALEQVSRRDDALAVLGAGPSLAAEVARNTALRSAPALPVADLYTGVLFDALALRDLPERARRRARTRLVVISALWGALRPGDRVPAYRLAMGTDLPGIGGLAGYWRPRLAAPLDAYSAGRLVVDCRSSDYAAAWRPAGEAVAVRVLRERDGRRSVVSHMAKRTRGLVARHLLSREGRDPRTVGELVDAVSEVLTCEPAEDGTRLDVVVPG